MYDISVQQLKWLALHGNRGRIAMLGTAYLDESADRNGEIVFLAAGFFLPDGTGQRNLWKQLRRKWRKALRARGVPYYRSYDCRTLSGGFERLKDKWGQEKARDIADRLRLELYDIIDKEELIIGFGMGIDLQAHKEVNALPEAQGNRKWLREGADSQVAAFRHLFCLMTDEMIKIDPRLNIAFVCDDSSYFKKINRGFNRVKEKFPELGVHMYSLTKADDKRTPELQMADLAADITREMIQKFIADGRVREIPPSAMQESVLNVKLWEKEGMLLALSGQAAGA